MLQLPCQQACLVKIGALAAARQHPLETDQGRGWIRLGLGDQRPQAPLVGGGPGDGLPVLFSPLGGPHLEGDLGHAGLDRPILLLGLGQGCPDLIGAFGLAGCGQGKAEQAATAGQAEVRGPLQIDRSFAGALGQAAFAPSQPFAGGHGAGRRLWRRRQQVAMPLGDEAFVEAAAQVGGQPRGQGCQAIAAGGAKTGIQIDQPTRQRLSQGAAAGLHGTL